MRLLTGLTVILAGLLLTHWAHAAAVQPQRVVSVGGALTEWVVALGGERQLVGIDSTSQHPESIRALPSVGYQRQLSSEGILTLRPDSLLGTEEMGPPSVIAQLRAAGVQIHLLSARAEIPALDSNLRSLGALLDKAVEAQQLTEQFSQRIQAQHNWVARAQQHQSAPGVLLLVSHAGSQPMVAGAGTVGDWLIKQAGGHNLATHAGYTVFSAESMTGLNPDVLIITDRAQNKTSARDALLKENPLLAANQAARSGRLVEIDPTLLVGGLGPRLPDAVATLASVFYPARSPLAGGAQSSQ